VSTIACATVTDLPEQALHWIQVGWRISVEIPSARGRAGCLPKRAQSRRCGKAAARVDLLKLRGFLRMAICKARDSKAQDGRLTGIVEGKRHSPIFAKHHESNRHSSGRSDRPQCLQECANSLGSASSKPLQKGHRLDQGWPHSGHRSKTNCERSKTLLPSRRSTTKRHFGFVQIKKNSMQLAGCTLSFCRKARGDLARNDTERLANYILKSGPPLPLGGGLILRAPHM